MNITNRDKYWDKNLAYVGILLFVWFFVSFFCGILMADYLNQFRILGVPMGFWFAQQGSIYIFVVLIFIYTWLMNRLDHHYNVDED